MISIQQKHQLPVPSGLLQVSRLPQSFSMDGSAASTSSLVFPIYFSLIIPTFNERDSIEKMVAQLSQILDEVLPNDYELLIVDDNSPDRTWEYAQHLTDQYPNLQVMRRQQERGLSTAVIRGWQAARGEVVGVIDADLQHPPEVLLKLLEKIDRGADLAVASRHVEGGGVSSWSATRRILSRGAQLLGLMILPRVLSSVSDPMSGYFLVKRQAIAEIPLNPVGYKILLEVIGRGNIRQIAEVGYVFQEREVGESKVTWRQYKDYLHHLVRLRVDSGRLGHWGKQINFPVGRFIRFAFVGLSGLLVDMALLYFFYAILSFGLTRSAIFAGELAIVNNFLWNDRWTFKDLAQKQFGRQQTLKRFLKFNIICLMGLILKILLLNLLFNGFHLNAYLANFLAIAIVTVWNFWINLKLNWRVTQVN
ncbi:glycosyltransferase [Leptolyngbyaceae cyanobacterium UHCC 1019]